MKLSGNIACFNSKNFSEIDLFKETDLGSKLQKFESINQLLREDSTFTFELVVCFEEKKLRQLSTNYLKLKRRPAVLYLGDRYDDIEGLQFNVTTIAPNLSNRSLELLIEKCMAFSRCKQKLSILKKKQANKKVLYTDSTINILTRLIHKFSLSENFSDVFESIKLIQPILQHCSLFLVLESEQKNKATLMLNSLQETIPHNLSDITNNLSFKDDIAIIKNSSDSKELNSIIKDPWSTAAVLRFESIKSKKYYYLFILRNTLVPFSKENIELLALLRAPLHLVLQKGFSIERKNTASLVWRGTYDSIQEPIVIIDGNNRIKKANKAMAKLLGIEIKSLKNKFFHKVSKSVLIEEKTDRNEGPRRFYVNTSSTQKPCYIAWTFHSESTKEKLEILFFQNISRESQLLSSLIQSEKMAALGHIIGAISHEINNPLTGIYSSTQILKSDKSISPSTIEDIEEISSAAQRSQQIIKNLLSFSGIQESAEIKAVNIKDAILAALSFSKSIQGQVQIDTNLDDNLFVMSNPGAMQQISFNLIQNAIHAMPNGGNLQVGCKKLENAAIITVSDTGTGMSSQQIENLFVPFYTNKKDGTGTGLGLSIVKSLINRMGGTITVDSKSGKGSTFKLSLPIAKILGTI